MDTNQMVGPATATFGRLQPLRHFDVACLLPNPIADVHARSTCSQQSQFICCFKQSKAAVRSRTLILLTTICCLNGCSFDSTFFPIDESPDDRPAPHQENIVLASADGRSIHHILIKPHARPKATILVFHGSGTKISNWTKLLRPLIDDGYQVFLMEYRGFGVSEGDASHERIVMDAQRAFLYLVPGLQSRSFGFFL